MELCQVQNHTQKPANEHQNVLGKNDLYDYVLNSINYINVDAYSQSIMVLLVVFNAQINATDTTLVNFKNNGTNACYIHASIQLLLHSNIIRCFSLIKHEIAISNNIEVLKREYKFNNTSVDITKTTYPPAALLLLKPHLNDDVIALYLLQQKEKSAFNTLSIIYPAILFFRTFFKCYKHSKKPTEEDILTNILQILKYTCGNETYYNKNQEGAMEFIITCLNVLQYNLLTLIQINTISKCPYYHYRDNNFSIHPPENKFHLNVNLPELTPTESLYFFFCDTTQNDITYIPVKINYLPNSTTIHILKDYCAKKFKISYFDLWACSLENIEKITDVKNDLLLKEYYTKHNTPLIFVYIKNFGCNYDYKVPVQLTINFPIYNSEKIDHNFHFVMLIHLNNTYLNLFKPDNIKATFEANIQYNDHDTELYYEFKQIIVNYINRYLRGLKKFLYDAKIIKLSGHKDIEISMIDMLECDIDKFTYKLILINDSINNIYFASITFPTRKANESYNYKSIIDLEKMCIFKYTMHDKKELIKTYFSNLKETKQIVIDNTPPKIYLNRAILNAFDHSRFSLKQPNTCTICGRRSTSLQFRNSVILPPVLIIRTNKYYSTFDPNTNNVYIETTIYIMADKYLYEYRLKSFIIHYGTPISGHYIAYCKEKEEWFKFDDMNTKQKITLDTKIFNHVYALLYDLHIISLIEDGKTNKFIIDTQKKITEAMKIYNQTFKKEHYPNVDELIDLRITNDDMSELEAFNPFEKLSPDKIAKLSICDGMLYYLQMLCDINTNISFALFRSDEDILKQESLKRLYEEVSTYENKIEILKKELNTLNEAEFKELRTQTEELRQQELQTKTEEELRTKTEELRQQELPQQELRTKTEEELRTKTEELRPQKLQSNKLIMLKF